MRIVRQLVLALTLLVTPTAANGQVERVATIGGLLADLVLLDDHVVASVKGGLYIINVSDPTTPTIARFVPLTGSCGDLDLQGDRLAVAAGEAGVHVLDMSDIDTPNLLMTVDGIDYAMDVAVSGDAIAVTDNRPFSPGSFRMIDVSGATPVLTEPINFDARLIGVVIAGDYAFAGTSSSGGYIIDISNPVAPTLHGADPRLRGDCIAYKDGVLYAGGSEITAFQVEGPNLTFLSAAAQTSGRPGYMAFDGDVLYTTELSLPGGFCHVIDISDPTDIQRIENIRVPRSGIRGIVASGDLVFYVSEAAGLHVVDRSLPTNNEDFARLGAIATPGRATGLHRVGDTLYVADGHEGLSIVDITDPAGMTIIGGADTPGDAVCVTVVDDIAFVGETDALRMIDVSDPEDPTLMGAVPGVNACLDIDRRGRTLYLAAGPTQGLVLLDVSDPASPVIKSQTDTPGDALRVSVTGEEIYVADGGVGFSAYQFDASMNEPFYLTTISTPGDALDIDVRGGFITVASGDEGIHNYALRFGTYTLRGSSNARDSLRVNRLGDRLYATRNADANTGFSLSYNLSPTGGLFFDNDAPADGYAWDVLAGVGAVFTADGHGVIATASAADSDFEHIVGTLSIPSRVHALDLSDDGHDLILGNLFAGVHVVNVADPGAPTLRGSTPTLDAVKELLLVNQTIYASDDSGETLIIDASDPDRLVRMEPFERGVMSPGMHADADRIALATGVVLEQTDPFNPTEITVLPRGGSDVRIRGDRLYQVEEEGLRIYDISNPQLPLALGQPTPIFEYDIDLQGALLLAARGDSRTARLFDVSDPFNVIQVFEFDDQYAEACSIDGRSAYLAIDAIEFQGVRIYDLTEADAPTLRASIPVPDGPRSIARFNNWLYVGLNTSGVAVFDIASILPCPGDVTSDNLVNFDDVSAILDTWGASVPAHTGADADGSGVIDFNDLNLLLDNWSATPCH